MKKINWEFDNKTQVLSIASTSKNAIQEQHFSFKLTRYKNENTHEERLTITSIYDGNENGKIETSLLTLGNDIKQLMKYGVAFSGTVFSDMRQQIENCYLELEPVIETSIIKMVDDSVIDKVITAVNEIIKDAEITEKDGLYHLTLDIFESIFSEGDLFGYDISDIKEKLKKGEYTKCQTGRYTNLARIKDKPTRVISFYKDKLGDLA